VHHKIYLVNWGLDVGGEGGRRVEGGVRRSGGRGGSVAYEPSKKSFYY
jgi:hypothetical protein